MLPETHSYMNLLCGHLEYFSHRLRHLTPEMWDWSPDVAAPTPRILATHTLQWLQCDRQHIAEADASKHHRVPEVPTDTAALCDAMDAENEEWRKLLTDLTPEGLDAKRSQFNQHEMTVRQFICHMIQNTIYKHGQFATLYFAQGLDGKEPYAAPFPNPIYEEIFGPFSPNGTR
ncbi:MAG: hypothetical protein JWL77_1615 [Chthonomonadaceae bacterium]|nr:hypothetical protein [Chthonomonadaceae bacterium]